MTASPMTPETPPMERLVVIGAGMATGRLLEHLFEAAPSAAA